MMRVEIQPALLTWARERAGLGVEGLRSRFPRLAYWERGKAKPTLKQLERFAKATYTPIGYFFLPEPPVEQAPLPDFRTIGRERRQRPSPNLLDTIYLCQQRQDWYRDFARSMGEAPLRFVGSETLASGVVASAARIRNALGLDIEQRRRASNWTDALRVFIEQADSLGVLVMINSVVGGSNHRKLDPREFRGFALSDDLAPLVFINGADTKAAQMFTLAHELAHLWLGESALNDAEAMSSPSHEVERWCNRTAAELLVPLTALRSEYHSGGDLSSEVHRLARLFNVSTLVVLRRIHDAGRLSRQKFRNEYEAEVERLQSMPRGGGGDFYRTLGVRAGKRFSRAVVTSAMEGRSSFTEAFRLLGCRKMETFRALGGRFGVSF